MLRKIKAIWELMRLEHGIMIAIAILIGSLIASRGFPNFDNFIFTFFTGSLLFFLKNSFMLYYHQDINILI